MFDFLLLALACLGLFLAIATRLRLVAGILIVFGTLGYMALQPEGSVLAFLILFAGLIMASLEAIIPGFGLFGILGTLAVLAGAYMANGNLWATSLDLICALLFSLGLVLVLLKMGLKLTTYPGMVLNQALTRDKGYSSSKNYDHLLGKKGISLTVLRPAGKASIVGDNYDVLSTGLIVGEKKTIQVVKVEGVKIFVEEVTS